MGEGKQQQQQQQPQQQQQQQLSKFQSSLASISVVCCRFCRLLLLPLLLSKWWAYRGIYYSQCYNLWPSRGPRQLMTAAKSSGGEGQGAGRGICVEATAATAVVVAVAWCCLIDFWESDTHLGAHSATFGGSGGVVAESRVIMSGWVQSQQQQQQ